MDALYRQLPEAYQQGLINLLIRAAFPEGGAQSCSVITTAPSQWFAYIGGRSVSIYDVSQITHVSLWRNEADIRDQLLEGLRTVGWPERLIAADYAVPNSQTRPDMVLLGTDFAPLAIIECKTSTYGPEMSVAQTKGLAQALSVKHAFVYDGERLMRYDPDSGIYSDAGGFPSPADLGLRPLPSQGDHTQEPSSRIAVARPRRASDLMKSLRVQASATTIIDHTLPWELRGPVVLSETDNLLPEGLEKERLDWLAAMIVMAASSDSTRRLVSVVPRAFASSSRYVAVRSYLKSSLGLSGVVELPAGFFLPITSIESDVLVLGDYGKRPGNEVAFAVASDRAALLQPDGQQWIAEFIAGLVGHQMNIGFLADVFDDAIWTTRANSPNTRDVEDHIRKIADTADLGDLCDVVQGHAHSRQETTSGEGVKIIRGRDLSSVPLTNEHLACFKRVRTIPSRCVVAVGDILLQRIGSTPKSIVVGPDLVGAVASDTVIILRPKHEGINSISICQFLLSAAGQELLSSRMRGVGAPTLSSSALRTIPIPLMPPEFSRDLEDLQGLERGLRTRADMMTSMRLDLFSAVSQEDLASRLNRIRQVGRAVAGSLEQVDSLQFRIRNFYPFPLAYAYRLLSSYTSPQDLYREQLRLAENILAFLASVTLAMIGPEQRGSLGLDLAELWRSGVSPGSWRDMAQKGAGVLVSRSDNSLMISLSRLWAQGGKAHFPSRAKTLIEAKNDFKHDRGPKGDDDCRALILPTQELLDGVMDELGFLIEYPILLVADLDSVRGSRAVMVKTLGYVGDHPGLSQGEMRYDEPLKKGDLFVQIRPDKLIPLYPFITARSCPLCKNREVYFVDRCDPGKGKALLKSFERGHTYEEGAIISAMGLA